MTAQVFVRTEHPGPRAMLRGNPNIAAYTPKFGNVPVQIWGRLVTGDYFYFRARDRWITLEVSAASGERQPVRCFLRRYEFDPECNCFGAGCIEHRDAVTMLLNWIDCFVPVRQDQLRRPESRHRYQVAVSPDIRPQSEEFAPFPSSSRRRELALAAQNLGLDVVTIDGPDDTVLIDCGVEDSGFISTLPGCAAVRDITGNRK